MNHLRSAQIDDLVGKKANEFLRYNLANRWGWAASILPEPFWQLGPTLATIDSKATNEIWSKVRLELSKHLWNQTCNSLPKTVWRSFVALGFDDLWCVCKNGGSYKYQMGFSQLIDVGIFHPEMGLSSGFIQHGLLEAMDHRNRWVS